MCIILDVVICFDIECGICLSENVVFGVGMGYYNICFFCFGFVVIRMKIN